MIGAHAPGSLYPGGIAAFAGGVPGVIERTDTLVTMSDTVARAAVYPRSATDTLSTFSGDEISGGKTVPLTDTLVTFSDTLTRTTLTRSRALTDTASTLTDTLRRRITRPLADTLATVTDDLVGIKRLSLADTLVSPSDTLVRRKSAFRAVTDTARSGSDTLRSNRRRMLEDTLATVSDSLTGLGSISIGPDTLVTISDTPVRRKSAFRTLTDTARSGSDTTVRVFRRVRSVTDTLATVSDALVLKRRTTLVDTLVSPGDTLERAPAVRQRALVDTAQLFEDTLLLNGAVARFLTDTLASVSDNVGRTYMRQLADTLVTPGDELVLHRIRGVQDTLTTMTVSTLSRHFYGEITDTIATVSDLMLSNDNFAQRTPLWGASGTIFGTNIYATTEIGEFTPGGTANTRATVWYEWTPPASGKYRFRVHPFYPRDGTLPNSDMWIAVYEHDDASPFPVLARLVFWNSFATWADVAQYDDAIVNFHAELGKTYDIQVGSWQQAVGTKYWSPFDMDWQLITLDPAADDFPGVTLDSGLIVNGNPEWATAEPGDPWYWIRDLDWPLNPSGPWIDGQYSVSNRTMIYKYTADQDGPITLTFYEENDEGAETGELMYWLFDGDGVTTVEDLTQDKAINSDYYVYGEVYTFAGIAGRDYYLWVTSDDGPFGPDGRHRLRMRGASDAVPPNDSVFDAISLDDELWHEDQSTENATWEVLRDPAGAINPTTPDPATIWYRASFDPRLEIAFAEIQFKDVSIDLTAEFYTPLRIDEFAGGVSDTITTMSDSLAIIPRQVFGLTDTLTTFSDSLTSKMTASRTMVDTGATIVDLGIHGPVEGNVGTLFDVLVAGMSDTVSKRVARRVSDFAGNQFGSGVAGFHTLQKGPTYRGRPLADTLATFSDALDVLELVVYHMSDTLTTMTDTVARTPAVRTRGMTATITTMGDQLTRVPPQTMTDTLTTMSDSVQLTQLLRGRAAVDRLSQMSDSISTNRKFVGDYLLWYGDWTTLVKVRRVTRSVTDTATTMSDGIS